MSQDVTRHFASLDGRWGPRQVHYRRAGAGPAVLLLHQSPQSSREMADLMRRWAPHFTLIAPDTPGYGQSDPLGPARVPIEDFAGAALEFANAIGLRRFGIYGYHTGASVGVWLAARHPERVAAVAANGLVQLTAEERADILEKYLPPLVPRWDGSHLAWLWGRVREQAVFFPWHERTAAARMDFDMPAPERLHAGLLEFLRAGDNYAIAYRAAFESRPETLLPDMKVPLLVTAAARDPLQSHLGRYGTVSPAVEVLPSDSPADALARCLEHLLCHRGDPCPAAIATRPIAGRLWNKMLRLEIGQVRVRMELSGRGEPLVLIHDAAGSADAATRLAGTLLGSRPLLIPDLPGHGESDPPARIPGPRVVDCARAVGEGLNAAGLSEVVLAGHGAGACVALDIAMSGVLPRPRLALAELPWLTEQARSELREHGMPAIEPQWHGGHLLLAWHMLRDGRLYFPWYDRTRPGMRRGRPDLDERRLQLELLDLLRASGCWQPLLSDALSYPIIETLSGLKAATIVGASPDSAWRGPTRAAAAAAQARFADLAPDPADWLPAMLAGLT
jgi:pimeloyl-ACP methyl ester carboxylesterase